MIVPKLKGRRAFVLKRCSSNSQVGTSIQLQDAGLAQLLKENEVVVVDQKDLDGVTGSIPGARDDIDQIIRLKREGLNFDLLIDISTVADRITAEMADLSKIFLGDDLQTVRQIVALLVGRMEVDLTTKETEIDLQVPDWMAASLSRQPAMGLDAMLASKRFNETHPSEGVKIATYRCQRKPTRPICMECHRVRPAA